jgi:hypothetical protein
MGKASSSKKVARAAKTGGRAGSGRNFGWPLLVGSVVVVGVLLIVLSRGGNADAVAPKLGDHWHAAYGIYDCDHFIPNLQDIKQDTTGLHTHGDGLMHMHPFGTTYTGHGANIGNWGDTTGLEVSDKSIKAAGIDEKNGDKCNGKAGTLKLKVWTSPDDKTGHLIDKDYADYAPQEFTMWVLAFVPDGADIPKPPQATIDNLQAPADVAGASSTVPVAPPSTEPGASSTTAPGSESSTSTSAPATTTTAAP